MQYNILLTNKDFLQSVGPKHGIFWVLAETESEITTERLFCILEMYSETDENAVFNHRCEWQKLDNKITRRKDFKYYPRGRVEIKNNKATIWLNPNIAHLANEIIKIFGLHTLSQTQVKIDGSKHYLCVFDR